MCRFRGKNIEKIRICQDIWTTEATLLTLKEYVLCKKWFCAENAEMIQIYYYRQSELQKLDISIELWVVYFRIKSTLYFMIVLCREYSCYKANFRKMLI